MLVRGGCAARVVHCGALQVAYPLAQRVDRLQPVQRGSAGAGQVLHGMSWHGTAGHGMAKLRQGTAAPRYPSSPPLPGSPLPFHLHAHRL